MVVVNEGVVDGDVELEMAKVRSQLKLMSHIVPMKYSMASSGVPKDESTEQK